MNTQSQAGMQLWQLRNMMHSMSVATISNIDEHGALCSSPMSHWEMDDCGALWFFTDPLSQTVVKSPGVSLTFADQGRTRRVSLTGRVEFYPADLSSQQLLGSIWLGRVNYPRLIAQARLNNRALLKFIPQSATYWQAQPGLMARLMALLGALLGSRTAPMAPGIQRVELPPDWARECAEPAA